jgi:hypothetical protein
VFHPSNEYYCFFVRANSYFCPTIFLTLRLPLSTTPRDEVDMELTSSRKTTRQCRRIGINKLQLL